MSTKPSVIPRFANVAPGAAVTPPAGKLDVGLLDDEQPPAGWLNWLFLNIYLWCQYLSDQAFTGAMSVAGAFTATSVGTTEADIKHGTRTRTMDLAEVGGPTGQATGAVVGWSSDSDSMTCPATTTGQATVALPLCVGDRLLAVRLICKAASGAAGDVRLTIRRMQAISGNASGTAGDAVTVVQSTATTNIQTITSTPGAPITVVADTTMRALISAFNSAGVKTAFRLEVDYDRP